MMVVFDIDHMFVKHLCFDHTVEMGMCCGSNFETCTGYDQMVGHNGLCGMCFVVAKRMSFDQSLGKGTSVDHMVAHPLENLFFFLPLRTGGSGTNDLLQRKRLWPTSPHLEQCLAFGSSPCDSIRFVFLGRPG